ncbi:uncharacterized protein LOC135935100 [Cloeon dipterum]|uniref:uncharacterized protein LOC135935100 n=1 Tax=Cloeon dipterum TaxID=197152 RepID=UPI0032203D2B
MDNKEKLKFAENKLQALNIKPVAVKSLQQLAAETVRHNAPLYLYNKERTLLLTSLSNDVKNLVLDRLIRTEYGGPNGIPNTEFVDYFQAFSDLLNWKTTEMDLDALMTFCRKKLRAKFYKKALYLLAEKSTHLQTLEITKNWNAIIGEQHVLRSVCRLRNLQTLTAPDLYLDLSDVMHTCKELEYLTHIELKGINVCGANYQHVDEFKKCLSRLEVFLFMPVADLSEGKDKFRRHCIKHLPNVQIFECRVEKQELPLGFLEKDDLPFEASALQHLYTVPTMMPLDQFFPEVKSLKVLYWVVPEEKIDSLLNFGHVECLELNCSYDVENVVDKFVASYGRGLLELNISGGPNSLYLNEIGESCPLLRKLSIADVIIENEYGSRPAVFPTITEFSWTISSNQSRYLLSGLLRSLPNLERLALKKTRVGSFELEDLQKVAELVAEGQLGKRLESFTLNFGVYSVELHGLATDTLSAFAELIKNSSVFLPNFSTVELSINLGREFLPMLPRRGTVLHYTPLVPFSKEIMLLGGEQNFLQFLFAFRSTE